MEISKRNSFKKTHLDQMPMNQNISNNNSDSIPHSQPIYNIILNIPILLPYPCIIYCLFLKKLIGKELILFQ